MPHRAQSATISGKNVGHMSIDGMIKRLFKNDMDGRTISKRIPERDIINLCFEAKDLLLSQPSFLEIPEPIRIVGDIHGQYSGMHGGLSPNLKSKKQLRQIKRPIDPRPPSMLIDILWSDPDPWTRGWRPSTRGISYVFGADVVYQYCELLDIDMIVRAHQVVQDGYEFFANRKLVTLFSAPHYCGQFDNNGATMYVDENLLCSFKVLHSASTRSRVHNPRENNDNSEKSDSSRRRHTKARRRRSSTT
ncbi:calcineurin-like phosphoesterase domain-containing protein [Ditylenchus destructor]|uniref:protein-serine/threonine phosphatase n=1 Tax=Ditylenchus destructor TaxID=166010 RepID=A0AAD4RAH3_9BILA|nr:calcineurin-like phosphoesterase domain-containing protein [Ditylenchus destructor]